MIVVDASLMIAHVLGETTLAAEANVIETLKTEQLLAPAHWIVEISNALARNVRRQRVSSEDVELILREIAEYAIEVVQPTPIDQVFNLISFASAHELTAYDAAYVMLALTAKAKRATLDQAMRRAATRLNIELIPEKS